MENTKQHVIVPNKGISNVSSNLTCTDDVLEDALNVVNVNGDIMPFVAPSKLTDIEGGTLVYVHDINNEKRYIFCTNSEISYYINMGGTKKKISDISFSTIPKKVTSIGKTLIVHLADNTLHYLLWQEDGYKSLGTKIPEPKFQFSTMFSKDYVVCSGSSTGMLAIQKVISSNTSGLNYYFSVKEGQYETWKNLYSGLYSEAKNKVADKNAFHNPFFVRGALEMYDGSYIYITNPVLICPFIEGPSVYYTAGGHEGQDPSLLDVTMFYSFLCVQQQTSYEDFTDIIRNVHIFVSDDAEIFEDKQPSNSSFNNWEYSQWATDKVVHIAGYDHMETYQVKRLDDTMCNIDVKIEKNRKDVAKGLLSVSSIYYKLCSIGLKPYNGNTKELIEKSTIKNLPTQTRLPKDDYFGWTDIRSDFIATQNRRLLQGSCKRSVFNGFRNMSNLHADSTSTREIFVELSIDGKSVIVKTQYNSNERYFQSSETGASWFYYPDPRAKRVSIFSGSSVLFSRDLKEHPGLNGAYCFDVYPSNVNNSAPATSKPTVTTPKYETLDNYLIQSSVDNPFVSNASSYVRVGQGSIIGVAGLTTALNNDAYKIATTLCFTTQGIWALIADDEGVFKTVPPAFSREVCNNPNSITMTDNAVFFSSTKGIMCVVGTSEQSVVCVSKQFDGVNGRQTFLNFLKDTNCRLIYDYKGQKIVAVKLYDGQPYSYVFDITSSSWWKIDKSALCGSNNTILSVCNDFPDTILQTSSSLYSFINAKERNDSDKVSSWFIKSRPMKFDGSIYLKSLRRLRLIKETDSTVNIILYGSNDCKNWFIINSLCGKPWRFFKYELKGTDMPTSDSISAILFETQVRYSDKPH